MSIKHLRPKQAAELLGIGLSTFWALSRTDSDFPELVRLSPACTIVRESDLEDYLRKRSAKGSEMESKSARAIAGTLAKRQAQPLAAAA